MSIADLRRDYERRGLSEAEVAANPVAQLHTWLGDAVAAGVLDATAMVLATSTPDGRPSARVVLLKALNESGLTFFTNSMSRKGQELAANPRAALTFFWPDLERQVRAEGVVEMIPTTESDEYFRSRPLDAQLGAWVSEQSAVIAEGRLELERKLVEVTARFAGREVPRPAHWGGYRLVPLAMEFWQGRTGRLHDRLLYSRAVNGWRIERLAP
jgi:pyridoxamine 5'-phosphate oxidase